MSITKRILKNSFFLSLTTLSDRLAELALFFLMARSLGPGFVGDYKTVVTFLTIFQNLANFGLMQLVMREVATLNNREQASELLISYGFAGLVIAVGLLLVMNLSAALIAYPPAVTLGIYVVSLALVPSAWRRVAEAVISGMENMEYIALVSFLGAAFRVVVTSVLLWRGGSLMAIFWVLVLTQLAVVPAYLFVINRFLARVRFRPKLANVLGMAREVVTFLFMGILVIGVGTQIDVLMIRKMTSAWEAGIYTAASSLVQTLLLVRPAILNSAFPNMSLLYQTSLPKFRDLTANLVRAIFVLLLPFPFAALLLAEPLVPFLLGADFMGSVVTLQVLIWLILPSFTYATLSRALVAGKEERRNIQIAGLGMLANVLLNLLLVPRWGATGAAVSSLSSITVAAILAYWVIRQRLFAMPLWEMVGKPLVCILLAALAWPLIRWAPLWLVVPLLGGIYVLGLIWTKAIPGEVIATTFALIRQRGRLGRQADAPLDGS